ncbi:MAG TPA: 16S rRNA (adenine(1518)-N(6)/adenine(1519)-N(6))-dimethyltransferase RsmA [Vicinamibacterales bacterium]|nr:16S rRNA (adenine(1518)-N(6)/adenine(1519)-N(6))-dimethyltransferase RsmA [Vicinamibacterales bacterium]
MKARRRFGQHFLQPEWAAKVLTALAPVPEDTFLEIGPGTGVLTLPLAARVGRVIAIEIDRDLAADLSGRLPPNATVFAADFLDVDVGALLPADAGAIRVAGNLPYNVSSPILRRLFELHETDERLRDATLMLQREVADRITAPPGTRDYGVLTVAAARHARIERVFNLPPGAFRPAPKVRSSLIRLHFRRGYDRILAPSSLEPLVRAVFGQRRKRIANALRPFAASVGAKAEAALEKAGIEAGRRPETLSLDEFLSLARAVDEEARHPGI